MLKSYPGSFTSKLSPRLLARYNIQDHSCKPLLPNKRLDRKEHEELLKEQVKKTRLYEESLRQSYNTTRATLGSYKQRRVDLRVQSFDVKQEKKRVQSEFEKFKRQVQEKDKVEKKVLRTNDELVAFSRKKTTRKTILDRRMIDSNAKISDLSKTQTEIYDEIDDLRGKIKGCKGELRRIKDIQARHFKKLLAEGQDTRTEGLAWILRALWDLGETVDKSCFPSYLDDTTVQAIEKIAHKQIEKDRLSKELTKFNRSQIAKKVTSSRDLLKTVKERIVKASHKVLAQDLWGVQRDLASKDLFLSLDKSGGQNLKDEINAIDESIKSIKDSEIYRITAECTLHFYERRNKVSLKQLISAVIGVECLQRHVASINRIRSNLEAQIASTRTFSFSSLS